MHIFYPLRASELKAEAKNRIKGNFPNLIIASVTIIVSSVLSNITTSEYVWEGGQYVQSMTMTPFSSLFSLFVAPVLTVGLCKFFLSFVRIQTYGLNDIKFAFEHYGQIFLGMLWEKLFVFLWSLLFLIPGIVKSIAYSMAKYVLADNPNVGFKEAIKISMVLTDGRKGEIFVVALSFTGWFILCTLTLGILTLYVIPLYETTMVLVYEQLKADAINQGRISAEIFDEEAYSLN